MIKKILLYVFYSYIALVNLNKWNTKMEKELLFVPKSSRTGTAFDGYKAISIAEGFAECTNHEIEIEAWAAIGQLGVYKNLQGFFYRSLVTLVAQEFLFEDFTINWDMVDQAIAFN